MSERRNFWYLLMALALLLTPFAMAPQRVRAAPPIFLVDTLSDAAPSPTACNSDALDGDCSLRQAIARANSWVPTTDTKEISFSNFTSSALLPITGPMTVTTGSRLPPITASHVQITADTLLGIPQIEIDANGNDAGLVLQGDDNLVKGLSIYGASDIGGVYRGTGVYITGARNTVQVSFLGLRANSSLPTQRNAYGVFITGTGATGNQIGGAGGDTAANYISGNSVNGIVISNASNNIVQNNFIGLKRIVPSPTMSIAIEKNDSYGIQVFSDTSVDPTAKTEANVIGGGSGLANVIGGNGQAGITISGLRTLTTTIQSNFIGIYRDADPDFGNLHDGIRIEDGASGTFVGGTAISPLVISDNGGYGVYIRTSDSTTPPLNTTISGVTYIGTSRSGVTARGNSLGGVRVELAARNTQITGAGNDLRIAGNQGPGVWITGASIVGSQITGALVGTNGGSSAVAIPNTGGGILVQGGAQDTTLSGNTISGNGGFGVRLGATKTVTLTGNLVGLDTNRTGTIPNTGPGINAQDASNTLIGGSATDANYVAGNSGPAIVITGTGALSSTVASNVIGLIKNVVSDTLYLKAAGNTGTGVLISGGPQNTTVTANTIANNTGSGVDVVGSTTLTTTLSLNSIGWVNDANNTPVMRANAAGITINAAQAVDIRNNDVRFNSGNAISVTDALTVTLLSNRLNEQTGNGVLVSGVSRDVQVLSNTIALNTGVATLVTGDSQRIRIQSNRTTRNAGGVVLQGTSIYTGGNDLDTLTLPNHGIDPPIFDMTSPLRFHLDQNGLVSGWVYTDTAHVSSCVPTSSCSIQFFRSGANTADGQGFLPLTITPVGDVTARDFATPNADGFFSGLLSNILPMPRQLLFAVTDGNGNTSEFGVLNVTSGLSMDYLTPVDGRRDAAPGQTVTYSLRLTNSGTTDLLNLNVTTGQTLPRWVVSPLNGSANVFDLPSNSTKTMTISQSLPIGTDTSVRAGIQDTTIVTTTADLGQSLLILSRVLTTTVLATPVVNVTTITGSGTAPPLGQVTHTYHYTNTGNVTVTLDLTKSTVDPASSNSSIWLTSLSTNQIVVGPGGGADVGVYVTVPQGSQVLDALGNPNLVTTYLTATAQVPFSNITLVVSDTTGVDLVPGAQMDGGGAPVSAQSSAEVDFFHNIINTSNGPAKFCLNYRSNSGSQVLSFLSQNSVAIVNNCFTLETGVSPKSILRLHIVVKVTDKLLPGDRDNIRVYLTNASTGAEIANASATNTVMITASPLLPRIWLPLIIL
ncbi:MAG: right-handed parallel beta-helix repeat-containing protein [Chloroflexales bacterium]